MNWRRKLPKLFFVLRAENLVAYRQKRKKKFRDIWHRRTGGERLAERCFEEEKKSFWRKRFKKREKEDENVRWVKRVISSCCAIKTITQSLFEATLILSIQTFFLSSFSFNESNLKRFIADCFTISSFKWKSIAARSQLMKWNFLHSIRANLILRKHSAICCFGSRWSLNWLFCESSQK